MHLRAPLGGDGRDHVQAAAISPFGSDDRACDFPLDLGRAAAHPKPSPELGAARVRDVFVPAVGGVSLHAVDVYVAGEVHAVIADHVILQFVLGLRRDLRALTSVLGSSESAIPRGRRVAYDDADAAPFSVSAPQSDVVHGEGAPGFGVDVLEPFRVYREQRSAKLRELREVRSRQ